MARVAQVSYWSSAPSLSNKAVYPYFGRTYPSDAFAGEVMVQMLTAYKWKNVGVLHVADVFRVREGGVRQLSEVLFAASVPDSYVSRLGSHPDKRQVATDWVDPAACGADFLPRYDLALIDPDAPVYLGALRCETP